MFLARIKISPGLSFLLTSTIPSPEADEYICYPLPLPHPRPSPWLTPFQEPVLSFPVTVYTRLFTSVSPVPSSRRWPFSQEHGQSQGKSEKTWPQLPLLWAWDGSPYFSHLAFPVLLLWVNSSCLIARSTPLSLCSFFLDAFQNLNEKMNLWTYSSIMCVCVCVLVSVCVCVCAYISISVCVCVVSLLWVCLHVFAGSQAHSVSAIFSGSCLQPFVSRKPFISFYHFYSLHSGKASQLSVVISTPSVDIYG